jgi:hypothetical protein
MRRRAAHGGHWGAWRLHSLQRAATSSCCRTPALLKLAPCNRSSSPPPYGGCLREPLRAAQIAAARPPSPRAEARDHQCSAHVHELHIMPWALSWRAPCQGPAQAAAQTKPGMCAQAPQAARLTPTARPHRPHRPIGMLPRRTARAASFRPPQAHPPSFGARPPLVGRRRARPAHRVRERTPRLPHGAATHKQSLPLGAPLSRASNEPPASWPLRPMAARPHGHRDRHPACIFAAWQGATRRPGTGARPNSLRASAQRCTIRFSLPFLVVVADRTRLGGASLPPSRCDLGLSQSCVAILSAATAAASPSTALRARRLSALPS